MKTSDIIKYDEIGFDWEKYIEKQTLAILERIAKFEHRLYLEIWWKFLYDPHASRVLPWFLSDSKKRIFLNLKDKADIIFCINAIDLNDNRQLSSEKISYSDYCIQMIQDIEKEIWKKAFVSINRINQENKKNAIKIKEKLQKLWFNSYFRYEIEDYLNNTWKVLSEKGYWKDEYIKVEKNLILVTWAASSSGKMSTCLWQIYQETLLEKQSGYAKYETFPIWNLSLHHPVNLAYEAATADIWDYNEIDHYHLKNYWTSSVNYNRDVSAFEIVRDLAKKFLPENNFTRQYKSPTDMWINTAWFCVLDENIIKKASIEEIDRRINWYKEIIDRWEWQEIWITRCKKLKERI